jgi:phosphatidylserine/phosphatidylglycerophosphate/cardiolipin synthase-like enzyme
MRYQIITNPAIDIFLDQVRNSREQLFACPFIKANVAKLILDNIPAKANISLLTSYKLANFYRGSSDLIALKSFIQKQVPVRNLPGLHAKTYIFDTDRAIITSANLTLGGLQNNYECGVLIDDSDIVGKLKSDFMTIFKDEERVSVVTEEIISVTADILAKVPKEKGTKFEKSEKELFSDAAYQPEDDLYDAGVETITGTLSGWRLDVFNAVTKVPLKVFKLDDVYAFIKQLQKLHPENCHVKAKIRQQLQELRNLGLIEFTGKGVYRKLWKEI